MGLGLALFVEFYFVRLARLFFNSLLCLCVVYLVGFCGGLLGGCLVCEVWCFDAVCSGISVYF